MEGEQSRRSVRREFIRAHHPDRGGDSAAFAAGLAELDQFAASSRPARVVVVVAHTPLLVRQLTALMHRAGWRRPPPRVR